MKIVHDLFSRNKNIKNSYVVWIWSRCAYLTLTRSTQLAKKIDWSISSLYPNCELVAAKKETVYNSQLSLQIKIIQLSPIYLLPNLSQYNIFSIESLNYLCFSFLFVFLLLSSFLLLGCLYASWKFLQPLTIQENSSIPKFVMRGSRKEIPISRIQ